MKREDIPVIRYYAASTATFELQRISRQSRAPTLQFLLLAPQGTTVGNGAATGAFQIVFFGSMAINEWQKSVLLISS